MPEEQRDGFYRRRHELQARFMNTTDFSEQCFIAQMFGELYEAWSGWVKASKLCMCDTS